MFYDISFTLNVDVYLWSTYIVPFGDVNQDLKCPFFLYYIQLVETSDLIWPLPWLWTPVSFDFVQSFIISFLTTGCIFFCHPYLWKQKVSILIDLSNQLTSPLKAADRFFDELRRKTWSWHEFPWSMWIRFLMIELSRWWFLHCFKFFVPGLRRWFNLTYISHMGWNQQLIYVSFSLRLDPIEYWHQTTPCAVLFSQLESLEPLLKMNLERFNLCRCSRYKYISKNWVVLKSVSLLPKDGSFLSRW